MARQTIFLVSISLIENVGSLAQNTSAISDDEEFEIGAKSSHPAKLFRRLAEKAITEGDDQLVGVDRLNSSCFIALASSSFKETVNTGIAHTPMWRELRTRFEWRFGLVGRFCPRPPVSETAVSTMTLAYVEAGTFGLP
jgi:hypothetical protein